MRSVSRPLPLFLFTVLSFFLVCSFQGAHANSKYAALVVHADTGDILFDKYSTQRRYPASLTKVMTLYLLFEELEAGRLTLDSQMTTSRYAASMPASDLGVKIGEKISVEEAIQALVVRSANDVAVVVAEEIGGTERGFAQRMTNKAWAMGMRSTQFRNASGLPNTQQYTNARDMAVLARRIMQDFPQYWHFFQLESFVYGSKTYNSHNKLVGGFSGAHGLKTGYTRASGYNLITTITRDENRLIGVVLGGRSSATRDAHMKVILNQAYKDIDARPTLIAATYRSRPTPNLKPTTLAELGGTWPPAEFQLVSAEDVVAAPTVSASRALQYEVAASAAQLASGADSLPTADDVGILISENMSDAEKLNALTLARGSVEPNYGEGDVEDPANVTLEWSIQTGAYSTEARAIDELTAIQNEFSNMLEGTLPQISEVITGGQSVYRVRFNYMTDSQSEQVCNAIIAEGGGCFVMRDRTVSAN